ncbi:phospholipid/cholesterol/gamma-HCH transport system substrate-binding protein [Amycolatopsis bartoniae]|uniref:ABC transporter substrate-binding protein n=1 Tax=Amycolatopsis bartoniae TaxID=941986 RepID=A0A8H9M9Y7_9PSEU|nr:MlaD family protein [Amycolatopsis bartoniae]MBB2937146.1 phospholipid/cholesterol/gamma-HCH transport system substrate-binding protein [Amycolatopsis bartoniae]TVT06019.1 MCE family protein [Amycolatopsis bartoniae]GHF52773.1 ABC transporter substrate-binding protein [Amycolatopsis bartoniae]
MRGLAAPLVKGLVFAVVTVLATALLAVTIANQGGGETVSYRARFTDVTSLNDGDDIRMAGVRVGQVEDIELVDRRFAEVTFSVDRDRKLAATVTATVKYRNLIGQRYVALDQGTGAGTLPPGGLIPLERTHPALDLTAVFNGFKPLFQALSPTDVNKLAGEIVQVLQGEGGTVDDLLRHTASLTSSLANQDQVIGQVVTNLNTVLERVNAHDAQLSQLLDATQRLVSGLAADAKPLGDAIDGIGQLTASAANLVQDGRAPVHADVDAVNQLAKALGDNTPEFEKFLANLPQKYEAIGRIASYGSWLNFYLCAVSSDAAPAPGGGPVGVPDTQARCGA